MQIENFKQLKILMQQESHIFKHKNFDYTGLFNKFSQSESEQLGILLSSPITTNYGTTGYLCFQEHLYVIDVLKYHMSETQLKAMMDNLVFYNTKNDDIVVSKIIESEAFDLITDKKEWMEKTGAIHCIRNTSTAIKFIEQYNIDINSISPHGDVLIHSLLINVFGNGMEPAINFILKNKEKIDFMLSKNNLCFAEQIFLKMGLNAYRGEFFKEKQELRNFWHEKNVKLKESIIYKFNSLEEMVRFLKLDMVILDKTGTETTCFKEKFMDICIEHSLTGPQHMQYFERCLNEMLLYKIKQQKITLNETVSTQQETAKVKRL